MLNLQCTDRNAMGSGDMSSIQKAWFVWTQEGGPSPRCGSSVVLDSKPECYSKDAGICPSGCYINGNI